MLPIPGLDPGPVDPHEAAFASGMLAGAGLREISQTLGLSRKRGGAGKNDGSMPSSATMVGGNMGDLDKIMLLARLKEAMGQGMGSPGAAPTDPTAMPMPGPGGPAGPLPGPIPGPLPLPGGPTVPLPGGMPLPIGPGAAMPPTMLPPIAPPGGVPSSPANPGGALPLQLLMRMLSGAGGVV